QNKQTTGGNIMHGTGDVAVRTNVVLLVMFFVAISGCVQPGAVMVDCGQQAASAPTDHPGKPGGCNSANAQGIVATGYVGVGGGPNSNPVPPPPPGQPPTYCQYGTYSTSAGNPCGIRGTGKCTNNY